MSDIRRHGYGAGLLQSTTSAGGNTVYTPGVSQRKDGVDSYFHQDWIGSTRYLTDSTGNTAPTAYRFDGYGVQSAGSTPGATISRFAGGHGYEDDGPNGLMMLGARYYSPGLGRFISPDPIGHEGGLNLYAYCDNDPVNAVDPSDLDWIEYNGQRVSYFRGRLGDTRQRAATFRATSGLPLSQNVRFQGARDRGPAPAGLYWVNLAPNPNRVAALLNMGGRYLLKDADGIQKISEPYRLPSGDELRFENWGRNRAKLIPARGTRTLGRSGFYLHDSDKGFSHGCVELQKVGPGQPDLFDLMKRYRSQGARRIDVRIRYDTTSTFGGTGP